MKLRLAALLVTLASTANAVDVVVEPSPQTGSYALSSTLVTGKYVSTGNDVIKWYQFMLKPASQSITGRIDWSITGTDVQDGYLTLQSWNSASTLTDIDGYKRIQVGVPYSTTAGSFEFLSLSSQVPGEWIARISPDAAGNFTLTSVPEPSTLILGFLACMFVAIVSFAKSDRRWFESVRGSDTAFVAKSRR